MENFKKIAFWTALIILALVFIYASFYKIAYPNEFYTAAANYQILPQYGAYAIAYFLPALELFAGLALLNKKFLIPSLTIICAMLVVFIVAILSAWIRGLDISCGCFGGGAKGEYIDVLIRDILLLVCCGIIFLLNLNNKLTSDKQYEEK